MGRASACPPPPDHPPSSRALLRCRRVRRALSTWPAFLLQPGVPGVTRSPLWHGQTARDASPTSWQEPEAGKPPPLTRKLLMPCLGPGTQRPSPAPLSQSTLPKLLTGRPAAHLLREKKPRDSNFTQSAGANKWHGSCMPLSSESRAWLSSWHRPDTLTNLPSRETVNESLCTRAEDVLPQAWPPRAPGGTTRLRKTETGVPDLTRSKRPREHLPC